MYECPECYNVSEEGGNCPDCNVRMVEVMESEKSGNVDGIESGEEGIE